MFENTISASIEISAPPATVRAKVGNLPTFSQTYTDLLR